MIDCGILQCGRDDKDRCDSPRVMASVTRDNELGSSSNLRWLLLSVSPFASLYGHFILRSIRENALDSPRGNDAHASLPLSLSLSFAGVRAQTIFPWPIYLPFYDNHRDCTLTRTSAGLRASLYYSHARNLQELWKSNNLHAFKKFD